MYLLTYFSQYVQTGLGRKKLASILIIWGNGDFQAFRSGLELYSFSAILKFKFISKISVLSTSFKNDFMGVKIASKTCGFYHQFKNQFLIHQPSRLMLVSTVQLSLLLILLILLLIFILQYKRVCRFSSVIQLLCIIQPRILEEAKQVKNDREVARKYGIAPVTIRDWRKQQGKLEKEIIEKRGALKRGKKSVSSHAYPEMEIVLSACITIGK